jgi:hypothetical protein
MADRMEWTRLDVRGSDSCTVDRSGAGWRLEGVADFDDPRGAAHLEYEVEADSVWQTLTGTVRGAVGAERVQASIIRDPDGRWWIGGRLRPDLAGLVDLDLGFTPATNLFPLRRLALREGQAADAEAALLDEETWTLRRLRQRYERRTADEWWYESPDGGYAALLRVDASGFVTDYPGLWRARE